ncbi:trypsin-like peptidase domain-containing protein [Rubripirellula sp.]|nr:trypsin-like peptidase domain-containing protein [Rubripirellula sp.]
MQTIKRIFACLLIVVMISVASETVGQEQAAGVKRYWIDSSGGFRVEASMKAFDNDSVTLLKTDGSEIRVPRSKLSKEDQEYLKAISTLQQSAQQGEKLFPHLPQVVGKPVATLAIIEALRIEFPDGIGANLYGAAIYAIVDFSDESVRKAKGCLSDAVNALRLVEKHFPGRHTRTYASALNNQAVLSIRQGNLNGAISNLIAAAELVPESIPFAVYHNASLIMNSGADLEGRKLSLAKIIASGKPEGDEVAENYLMYTLIHDPLNLSAVTQETQSDASTLTLQTGETKIGTGSGFLISPDLVLTNRHVAEGATRFEVKNDSGFRSEAEALKVSSSDDIDLALLKLKKKSVSPPLSIRKAEAKLGEELVVLGYPMPNFFEESLTVSRGVVSKSVTEGLQLLHDASTDPGNSGGPCVDQFGNVIGVHYAGSAVAKNSRNYAVSTTGIEQFLNGVTGYAAVAERTESKGFSDTLQEIKDSVFIIDIYGTDVPKVVAQQSTSTNLYEKYALIADRACLACGGRGLVSCGGCIRGVVHERATVRVAVNDITGEPIFAQKTFKKPCGRCNRGFVPCPVCKGRGSN